MKEKQEYAVTMRFYVVADSKDAARDFAFDSVEKVRDGLLSVHHIGTVCWREV